jgi:membrane protease subunit HflK
MAPVVKPAPPRGAAQSGGFMAERDVTQARMAGNFSPRAVGVVIGVVVLFAIIVSSVFVVDQRETAVVLRFGRFQSFADEGLHFKLPFGIDRNINVETEQIKKLEFGYRTERAGVQTVFSPQDFPEESIMLTGDLNIVDVEWSIQYRIVNPRDYLFNVLDQEKTLRDISQSVINQLVGDRAILDVIGTERENIEFIGQQRMNEIFASYGLGINVTALKLQNIVPPKGAVQNAFEDVNKAIQDRNRLINEGKEAYNQTIPRANGRARQLIAEAEGYKAERLNRAEGDVARFVHLYEEYRKSPEVTRTRLYYEMFEEVFKDAEGTDLIDKNLTNFIPLKQLGQELSLGGNQ